jgi:hypothetical protein
MVAPLVRRAAPNEIREDQHRLSIVLDVNLEED